MYKQQQRSYGSIDQFYSSNLEELLINQNDWRGVNEVVRISIKTISEAYKHQSELIREIEKSLSQKISKNEFIQQLGAKTNTNDASRMINELSSQIQNKVSLNDFQSLIQDYVSRAEFKSQMKLSLTQYEIDRILNDKINILEIELQKPFQIQMEEIRIEFMKRIQNLPTINEFEQLAYDIQMKANKLEVQDQYEQFNISRQQIHNLLNQKINKNELEILLNRKIDVIEIQNILDKQYQNFPSINQIQHIQAQINQQNLRFDHIESDLYDSASASDEKFRQVRNECNCIFFQQIHLVESINENIIRLQNNLSSMEIIQIQLDKKINQDDLYNFDQIIRKELNDNMDVLKNEILFQKRQNEEYINEKLKKLDFGLEKLNEQIIRLREGHKHQLEEQKNLSEELNRVMRSQKKDYQNSFERITSQIDAIVRDQNKHFDQKNQDFQIFVDNLNNQLEMKVDIIEVQNAINMCQTELSLKIKELSDNINHLIGIHDQELLQLINKKANLNDVTLTLSSKVDQAAFNSIIKSFASINDVEQSNKLNETLANDVQLKCDLRDFREFTIRIKEQIDQIQLDINKKSNQSEILNILDQKSNHEDVGRAFNELQREMQRKCNLDDFRKLLNDQALVNESLCGENIVARWTYKGGQLCSGSLVPWNIQVVNTLPDNFLWEKDKSQILIVNAGIYELNLGFYAKKKPKVDVLVNGEIVMGAINTASYVIHHSSGKMKDLKQSSGCINGLTLIDFIILPSRARLSIAYTGDLGEGFIGLKRL